MTKDFKPRRWLSNGHLQTIVGNFLRRVDKLPAATTEFVPVPLPPEMHEDHGHMAAFQSHIVCHCHWQKEDTHLCPTVVLVHGLEGSSNSQYVIGNANKLFAAGCNVVRMNMRNCGWTDALSGTLYHSGMSCDVIALMEWLIARGMTWIALAGYSMGGNLVLKAVGELGTSAPPQLKSVVAVSPPMDLGQSADALGEKKNWIYQRRFMKALRIRYRRKRNLFPAIFPHVNMDGLKSVREYDEHVMAPQSGFTGADDYYARSGAYRVMDRIAVPTLILHAWDDPFIRLTPPTREKLLNNPHIFLLEPQHGGHCAFLADPDPAQDYDGYWAEYLLRSFVMEHA
ncbi:MAG: alpha/beta fold hydrolase [Acidobacteria bacterium]|nr:alpha/beta fold hydrolase [Acidobacteriota bacterium]